MGKVEDNKKFKKESLLNSALELFTTKGLTDTSVSDIAKRSGVAKGTFYLYFKDKLDIRDYLIARESSRLFLSAYEQLERDGKLTLSQEEQLICILDHIIDDLAANKVLLRFISKNLSWGLFEHINDYTADNPKYARLKDTLFSFPEDSFRDTTIMLYMIIELTGSTCYDAILGKGPVKIDELKPYLFQTIRDIIENHRV